jgi:hypothetical protein
MILQYILLAIFLITTLKTVIVFLNKDNLSLMRRFLKTGDPKEWVDSEKFRSNVIWVLIATMFCLLFFWFYAKDNGLILK